MKGHTANSSMANISPTTTIIHDIQNTTQDHMISQEIYGHFHDISTCL